MAESEFYFVTKHQNEFRTKKIKPVFSIELLYNKRINLKKLKILKRRPLEFKICGDTMKNNSTKFNSV